MHQFTNLYPLSKTLKFELIPQGKTLAHIEAKGILAKDEKRAESYKKVKEIIDRYHKAFIDKAIDDLQLKGLTDYISLYLIAKKTDDQNTEFQKVQADLRKEIADQFTKNPDEQVKEMFKNLFAKELIKEDLKRIAESEEEQQLIGEFDSFTTYFKGFHENRKNIYSAEEKSTAIAFRLVHQNLPMFLDNMQIFEKIKSSEISLKFPELLKNLEMIIQVKSVEECFSPEYFNETLSQKGIEKYNALLGGYSAEGTKEKIRGLNEYINLHNQQQDKKENKIARLKPLYKQILSDRNSISFLPEEFEDDNEVLESIQNFYLLLQDEVFEKNENDNSLPQLLANIENYDLNRIFIKNDIGLTDLSQQYFGSWSIIKEAVYLDYDNQYSGRVKKDSEKYESERQKYFNRQESFSIAYINSCLTLLPEKSLHKKIESFYIALGATELHPENYLQQYINAYKATADLLEHYPEEKDLAQDKEAVSLLKVFLDSIKGIQHFIKPLLGKGTEPDKDDRFNGELSKYWEQIDKLTPLYNMVRNYMTRKPYSTEKIKVNFDNSTLLAGWDANKEEANTSLIFRKGTNFYLGIMDMAHNKIFRKLKPSNEATGFEKMTYKLLPGASKMLPKVFFSAKNADYYAANDEIHRIRNSGSHTKNGQPQAGFAKADFDVNDCRTLIDFFKASINKHPEWKEFGFTFSPTEEYNSIDGFYREVENQGYSVNFSNYNEAAIHELVEEGKLYLFQIYNKDFSPHSKGRPNMHTLYWRMLFDKANLENVVYKLNGEAEVFYRKASIKKENMIIHAKNEAIKNKNIENKEKDSTFAYDIIKDRRYTVDKFHFHVPITLNFQAAGTNNINPLVNEYIQKNGVQHIIGIDRGERHLLYLTLIDLEGKIIKQKSLNEIVNEYQNNKYPTNYQQLLGDKEKQRADARANWKTIETIKELKEGYLSQAVHVVTQMMMEYNAIVVLEDLNMGFKRGRQKVEKQVYQKFEKMLIDKLNYLVDKTKEPEAFAGTLKALQLSNKFESFQKMGKQSGYLFYTQAWNTSKMDPVTGFVNLLYTKYETIDKTKAFIQQFDLITYNAQKQFFEFGLQYSNFTNRAEGSRNAWTLCTYGPRIITERNKDKNSQWDSREVNLTEEFIQLFTRFGITYTSEDLREKLIAQTEKAFFENFMYLVKLTLQMRNSISNTETDYMISPVMDEAGNFYDSRHAKDTLPENADANGAYNIARKGLWIVGQIKQAEDLKKINLAIKNKDWLIFAQQQKT